MREEVEACHEEDGVDAQEPVALEHLLGFVQEDAPLAGTGRLSLFESDASRTEEDLGLGRDKANEGAKGGDAGSGPEERTPARGD